MCYIMLTGDMHWPVGLEHVPELDQAVLWHFNQLILDMSLISVSVCLRHFYVVLFYLLLVACVYQGSFIGSK